MSARRAGAAAFACAATIAVAACGGGDDEPAKTVTQTETSASAEQVVVDSAKDGFNPEGIYRKASPGVVTILSIFGTGSTQDILGGGGAGQGSGFAISEEGEILTNAHVVTTGGKASGGGPVRKARSVFVEFADHNRVEAEIVGTDPDADVALIKVDPGGLDITPVELDDGEGLAVGQPVAAIGSPFGEEQSLSIGVISATDRTIESLTDFSISDAIQTDASINPGNSGGPLLNADGQVIGINQQIESQSGSNAGVGFAVPISAVRYSLDQLRSGGKVEYAFIGVTTQSLYPQLADELGLSSDTGALIADVTNGSPADDAGLQPGDKNMRFQGQEVSGGGDLIVAIGGKPVESSADVARLISDKKPGETVTFEVIRDGEHQEIDVKLSPRPGST